MNNLLKNSSLKSTPQRVAILQAIEESGHLNIDEIYEKVVKVYPSVSLATIYKNINSLKEENLLLELPLKNMKPKYEIIKKRHAHFICKSCKKVVDVEIKEDYSINHEEIGDIEDGDIFLYGVCKNCLSK